MHTMNLTLEKLIFSRESNYFPLSQDKVIYFPCSFDSFLEMCVLDLKYEALQPQAAIGRIQHIRPYLQDDPTPAPLHYSHRLKQVFLLDFDRMNWVTKSVSQECTLKPFIKQLSSVTGYGDSN